MNIVNQKDKISEICRKYEVKSLSVFGSVLTENFSDNSDIDLLVTFIDKRISGSFDRYFGLKEELENLFGRNVDLVCEGKLTNPYLKKNVDITKQVLYFA